MWAPDHKQVDVVIQGEPPKFFEMKTEENGYWAAHVPEAHAGSLYKYRLDGDPWYPDPASRFQPDGPHSFSQVIDPAQFRWRDANWQGVSLEDAIVYEMHVGTFTAEGTWQAALRELACLADLGITVLEVMPVNEFPGKFGWGYDGVHPFAPTRLYGAPDDFRRFVDEAHALGMAVILDVVYNHLGPDGNYLSSFSPHYFTTKHKTDWGKAINFYAEHSGPVREFFIGNAGYWIDEFHLDGLRLDATQNIYDESENHILAAITREVRRKAGKRSTLLIGENEPQDTKLIRPLEQGGYGLDALWNDDFHHAAMVRLTGHNEAYYTDYLGAPQEFVSAAKYGYLYQGQWYKWQKQRRGTPALRVPPSAFVNFIQNHDQVANTARGERPNLLAAAGKYRAMTALFLLMPGTPMLFQGQEFGATTPFPYFCDHNPDLAKLVRQGRAKFLAQFPSYALPEIQAILPDPNSEATFLSAKLDFSEREKNAAIYQLYKDLIALRRTDPVFARPRPGGIDGAVLGPEAFVLRYFSDTHGHRLLIVNFGRDCLLAPNPEPLLGPFLECPWRVIWSSEDPKYGGIGTVAPKPDENWRIPGNAAVVMTSEEPK